MTSPLKIKRTLIARAKLKEIYAYSCLHWGEAVADRYLADLESIIQQAAHDQNNMKSNPDFSTRFTYSSARQHFIFFEVQDNTLIIATIFHGTMDIKERLAEEMIDIQRELDETNNE